MISASPWAYCPSRPGDRCVALGSTCAACVFVQFSRVLRDPDPNRVQRGMAVAPRFSRVGFATLKRAKMANRLGLDPNRVQRGMAVAPRFSRVGFATLKRAKMANRLGHA